MISQGDFMRFGALIAHIGTLADDNLLTCGTSRKIRMASGFQKKRRLLGRDTCC
jgi:hypothetical protein